MTNTIRASGLVRGAVTRSATSISFTLDVMSPFATVQVVITHPDFLEAAEALIDDDQIEIIGVDAEDAISVSSPDGALFVYDREQLLAELREYQECALSGE